MDEPGPASAGPVISLPVSDALFRPIPDIETYRTNIDKIILVQSIVRRHLSIVKFKSDCMPHCTIVLTFSDVEYSATI